MMKDGKEYPLCREFCEKDFCSCARIRERNRWVNRTFEFLKENNIPWEWSNVDNVVILNPGTDNSVHMSLLGSSVFKCRFKGSAVWYKYSREKLIKRFGSQ